MKIRHLATIAAGLILAAGVLGVYFAMRPAPARGGPTPAQISRLTPYGGSTTYVDTATPAWLAPRP